FGMQVQSRDSVANRSVSAMERPFSVRREMPGKNFRDLQKRLKSQGTMQLWFPLTPAMSLPHTGSFFRPCSRHWRTSAEQSQTIRMFCDWRSVRHLTTRRACCLRERTSGTLRLSIGLLLSEGRCAEHHDTLLVHGHPVPT